jgi:Arc/MetJ-type ribon-helix-helix transcriptional regulator
MYIPGTYLNSRQFFAFFFADRTHTSSMPNQRALGQKLISVPMKERFIEEIDQALEQMGYSDRSSFIRDAIAEKLHSEGIQLPVDLPLAPSRAGKGGRPTQAAYIARRAAQAAGTMTASASRKMRKQAPAKGKVRVPRGATSAASFGRNHKAS